MTVGEFLKLLSEDTSWTEGEDFGNESDILLRKNCAWIIHRYLQKVACVPDETVNLPSCTDIPDLYDCRICAPHIIQVVAQGIIGPHEIAELKLFEGEKEVVSEEAVQYIEKASALGKTS